MPAELRKINYLKNKFSMKFKEKSLILKTKKFFFIIFYYDFLIHQCISCHRIKCKFYLVQVCCLHFALSLSAFRFLPFPLSLFLSSHGSHFVFCQLTAVAHIYNRIKCN